MWNRGDIATLADRVQSQRILEEEESRKSTYCEAHSEKPGQHAKRKARKGALPKAVVTFNGKMATPTREEKEAWAATFIPQAEQPNAPTQLEERAKAQANHVSGGDLNETRRHLTGSRAEAHTAPQMPWTTFPALTAPGPTGERHEHLRDCMETQHAAKKRQMRRKLDELTIQVALGKLSVHARWLLDTSLIWLNKQSDKQGDNADGEDWLTRCFENSMDGESHERHSRDNLEQPISTGE